MTIPAKRHCPAINRVDIAWVCVATNDENPLHLDHEFAKNAGYKDVVVPGHLLIGWIGQYLEDWCGGAQNLLNWRLRFTAPVWPGDCICLQGELSEVAADIRGATAVTVNAISQEGKVVGIATAELCLSESSSVTN